MTDTAQRASRMALIALWVVVQTARAGTTNGVPWSDSFESYADGVPIAGTNGWWSDGAGDGVVTSAPAVVSALTNYLTGIRSYPIAGATHTLILQATNQVRNETHSATGGVVALDLMARVATVGVIPYGDSTHQFAFVVSTNGHVLIWHRNMTGGAPGVNEWLELSNPPLVDGDWARFTFVQDYAHNLFQLSVNEGQPLTNAVGWAAGGTNQPGSWFFMVQTNGVMARIRFDDAGTNYLDDMVVTNRSMTWSGGVFVESLTNNGTIDPGTTLVGTLLRDTWAGTNGEDLVASGKAVASGLPLGLTGVVQVTSATQVTISVSGAAVAHEPANSVSNGISVTFADGAFALGNAWDVTGRTFAAASVAFLDTPRLSWSGSGFTESAANDGSFDSTNGVLIGLQYGTFNGAPNENFGTNGLKVAFTNMPAGLSGAVTLLSATQLQMRLIGNATAHAATNSLANLGVTFLNGAFNVVPASSVFNVSTNLSVTFTDPGVLTYTASVFSETVTNNGAVSGTTLTLVNKNFDAGIGENLVGGKVTVGNVPSGLTLAVTLTDSQHATLSFLGTASAHASANNIANLSVTFNNSAFVGGNAAGVVGGARSDLAIQFNDPPVVSWQGTVFTEAVANDGTIGNSNVVNLSGTSFTGNPGDNFVTGGKVTVGNVPTGLTAVVRLLTSAQVSVQLTGTAAPHRASSNTGSLTVQFLDGAFVNVAAANVVGVLKSNLSVTFNDAASLAYGVTTFAEKAANDGSVGGGAIALTGDTLTGGDGDNFVTAGKVTVGNVPAGLTAVVTRTNATGLAVTFTGKASAHTAANSIQNLSITFLDGAFAGGHAAGVVNGVRSDLAIQFNDQPVVSALAAAFLETGANDGSIGNTLTLTLNGEAFTGGPYAAGAQYTVANVPPGLAFVLTNVDATHVTARLTGNATSHAAINSITNLHLTFLDGMFANVAAADVNGHPIDFTVSFNDPPALTYSGDTFVERAAGYIDNRNPVTITLTGDVFGGMNGDDFVAAGKVMVANAPTGLTAQITRDSDTQLSVQWGGAAMANSNSDTVTNVTFTFLNTAFANALANQVANNPRPGLIIVFTNDSGLFNVMPYEEPFETYSNGTLMAGTNGWSADVADAGIVTNDPAVTANEMTYLASHSGFPAGGDHRQVLTVEDDIRTEIHSESNLLLYLDFMTRPAPNPNLPDSDTNRQYAFTINTNLQVVIWHQNRSAVPYTNEWLSLAATPAIDTSRWVRFTVAQDYALHRFQIRVNESVPITNAAGWNDAGSGRPGSWFYMVQTNSSMTRFKVLCNGPGAYLDDVTVRKSLTVAFGQRAGVVFKFR